MKSQKNGQSTAQIARYFVIYKRASLKMHQYIKQASPSRQLFKAVNFAFMKIFDFLVKIAISWAFLLFLGDLCHEFLPGSNVRGGP